MSIFSRRKQEEAPMQTDTNIEAQTTRRRLTMTRLTDAQNILSKLELDQGAMIERIQAGERGVSALLEAVIDEAQRQRDTVTALEDELTQIDRELETAHRELERRQRQEREAEWSDALAALIEAYEDVAGPAQRLWALIDARSVMVNEQDWRHLPDRGGWIRLNGTAVKIGGGNG